jgi:hypothetical protein
VRYFPISGDIRAEEALNMWKKSSTSTSSDMSPSIGSNVAPERPWAVPPEQFALWWSALVFVLNTIALLYFHFGRPWAAVDPSEGGEGHMNPSSLHLRWLYPTYIDMILFSALIIMAFELLDFITKHVGRT